MTEQNTSAQTDNISKRMLIVAIILTAVATVAVMEWQGMLKHTSNKDDYALSSYKAIFIEKQDDEQYRLSRKPSNQSAQCHDGFLFIQSDANDKMQGLLVDYKNRGVKCEAISPVNLGIKAK